MQNQSAVVGLGEILWDIFDDAAVFGGAPANFACHAAGFGLTAVIKSAVGNDPLGDQALAWLAARPLRCDFVAVDAQHPTGTVHVRLDSAGHPDYQFAPDVAWDHLQCTALDRELAQQAQAICFGTLAQRSLPSRHAIQQFVDSAHRDSWRILDVNLRANFYDDDVIRESIQRANALKLNNDEWPVVTAALGETLSMDRQGMQQLADRYELRCIALTRGHLGSLLWLDGQFDQQVPEAVQAVDTVGAGDAFTAALIAGLLKGQSLSKLHQRASRIAAYVCTQRGATPTIPISLVKNQ
ncbi:MAG: carbohydrate kinase family protein [Pirellulaceae bacterium]|jgi:fructokinase